MGSDAWDALKAKLKKAFGSPGESRQRILEFRLVAITESQRFEVLVLIDEDHAEQIDNLLSTRFKGLDEVLTDVVVKEPAVGRVAIAFREGGLKLLYAVRRDGFPTITTPAIDETKSDALDAMRLKIRDMPEKQT